MNCLGRADKKAIGPCLIGCDNAAALWADGEGKGEQEEEPTFTNKDYFWDWEG